MIYLLKLSLFFFYVVAYILNSFWGYVRYWHLYQRRLFFMRNTSKWAKRALRLLHISIQTKGLQNLPVRQGNLFVCNHLSYLDIVIIASLMPTLFITSVDLKKHILQALLATMGGSLFIERRNKSQLLSDIEATKRVLDSDLPIFLFPEGTTSDGTSVQKFKASLFAAAQHSKVVPFCIKYLQVNGKKVNKSNRDSLYYYGKIKFIRHFIGLVRVKSAKVRVSFLGCLDGSLGRKKVCQTCYEKILAEYCAD